jgi:hypothetical protein
MFDGNNLSPEATPDDLAMEDYDEIDAMLSQVRCAAMLRRCVAVLALIPIRCHRLAVDSRQRRAAVIVDGDLVGGVLLLLFHNKSAYTSLIYINLFINALRADYISINWQEPFEKMNWLVIYITFVVAKRW